MSALLTHAIVGLLLGLALRLRLRYLPLAAFLAVAPDLDHLGDYLPLPFLASRVTFTNVAFCIVAPLAVYAALHWRDVSPEARRVAAAAPLLLVSHLLLDILPLEPFGVPGRAAILWPFSTAWFSLSDIVVDRIDPREFSTLTVVLGLLAAGALATIAATHVAERDPPPPRARRWAAVGAFAAAWLLLFPALAAAGVLESAPRHAQASFALEDAGVHVPEARFRAVLAHAGGESAPAGRLVLDVLAGGAVVATAANWQVLAPGERWELDVPVTGNPRAWKGADVRVTWNASLDRFIYLRETAPVVRGHLDLALSVEIVETDGKWLARVANAGPVAAPAGALRVLAATEAGAALANATNAALLTPGGAWEVPLRAPPKGVPFTVEVAAVDDGHVYARREAGAP